MREKPCARSLQNASRHAGAGDAAFHHFGHHPVSSPMTDYRQMIFAAPSRGATRRCRRPNDLFGETPVARLFNAYVMVDWSASSKPKAGAEVYLDRRAEARRPAFSSSSRASIRQPAARRRNGLPQSSMT